MAFKLSRLAMNWSSTPEMMRRYWDQAMTAIEFLVSTPAVSVDSLPVFPVFQRAMVFDANSSAFGTIVVGGGGTVVPVYYDGTSWRIG